MTPPLDSHSIVAVTYLMARGRLRAAQGRDEEALQDFLACGERCERLGIVLAVYPWRSEAAIANAALGHEARAAGWPGARSRSRARSGGLVRWVSHCVPRGLVEGGDRGLDLLAKAVTVLGRSQAPVELARALTDHGAALRRAGQRTRRGHSWSEDWTWRITGARAASRARPAPNSSRQAPSHGVTRSPAATP